MQANLQKYFISLKKDAQDIGESVEKNGKIRYNSHNDSPKRAGGLKMQLKEYGVCLGDLIQEFNFEVMYGPEGFEKTEITKDDVSRPGLQLAGFFDFFDPNRLQVIDGTPERLVTF